MSIVIEPTSDQKTVVVRVGKALDFRNAAEFKRLCLERTQAGVQHFILDFSGTVILDSTALGAIFSIYRQVSPENGEMAFAAASGAVKMVVEMTKLNRVFAQYTSVQDALDGLSSASS